MPFPVHDETGFPPKSDKEDLSALIVKKVGQPEQKSQPWKVFHDAPPLTFGNAPADAVLRLQSERCEIVRGS